MWAMASSRSIACLAARASSRICRWIATPAWAASDRPAGRFLDRGQEGVQLWGGRQPAGDLQHAEQVADPGVVVGGGCGGHEPFGGFGVKAAAGRADLTGAGDCTARVVVPEFRV